MNPGEGNAAVLQGALKELLVFWESTAYAWKDAARENFENDILRDLAESVRSASNAVAQVEALLRQVRRECS